MEERLNPGRPEPTFLTVSAHAELARAATTTAAVPAGTNPDLVAVDPLTDMIYVAVSSSATANGGYVTVINGATNATTTISTGSASYPYALAVNPVTDKIYVSDENESAVVVIDGATNTATATVRRGGDRWAWRWTR